MLLLTFPPCKQWPCNFNLLCFVGSSQDNSLKSGMWEFLQPGMRCHDYASTQGRRGDAPLLSLGTCSHLWGPKHTDFLQAAKPGVENEGAEGPLESLKPIGKRSLLHLKMLLLPTDTFPFSRENRSPGTSTHNNLPVFSFQVSADSREKLTEGSSSCANIWREMHREFCRLC